MAIKLVTTEHEKEPRPKYPYFAKNKEGMIAYFVSCGRAIIIFGDSLRHDTRENVTSGWDEEYAWKPIEGVITFQNEF